MKLLTSHASEEDPSDSEAAISDPDAEEDAEASPEATEKPKKRRRRSIPAGDIEAQLAGKFVNLGDVLPKLPEKGKFDVRLIKDSQYFFS